MFELCCGGHERFNNKKLIILQFAKKNVGAKIMVNSNSIWLIHVNKNSKEVVPFQCSSDTSCYQAK